MSFAKGSREGGSVGIFGKNPTDEVDSAKTLIFGEEHAQAQYVAPAPGRCNQTSGLPMPPIRSAVNNPRERRSPSDMEVEAFRRRKEESQKSFLDARKRMEDVRNAQMRNRDLPVASEPQPQSAVEEAAFEEGATRSNADLIATGLQRRFGEAPEVLNVAYAEAENDEALDATLREGNNTFEEDEHLLASTLAGTAGSDILRKSVTISDDICAISPRGYDDALGGQMSLSPARPGQLLLNGGAAHDMERAAAFAPEPADCGPVLKERNAMPEPEQLSKNSFKPGDQQQRSPKEKLSDGWWPHEAKKKGPEQDKDKELRAFMKATDDAVKEARFNAACADAFRDARAAREMGKAKAEQGGRVFGAPGELQLSVSGARKRQVGREVLGLGAAGGGGRGKASEKAEDIGLTIFGGDQAASLKPRAPAPGAGPEAAQDLQSTLQAMDDAALQARAQMNPEAAAFHDARIARELQVRKNRGGSLRGGLFGKDPPQVPAPRMKGENVITWA